MYAVYGLDESKKNIETFIGYVPASFFETFTDPTDWQVKMVELPNGDKAFGRLFHRAFFVQQLNLRASKGQVAQYMGICPDSDDMQDADTEV